MPTNTYRFQQISTGLYLGDFEGKTIYEAHLALTAYLENEIPRSDLTIVML